MPDEQLVEKQSGWTIERRKEFMKLPIDERRRQLAEQADPMVGHYSQPQEMETRESWQGGDIADLNQ